MTMRLPLLILFTLLLTACQNYENTKRFNNFDMVFNGYIADLRWARFQQLADYHLKQDGSLAEIDRDKLAPIKVTQIQVMEKILAPEMDRATVVLDMSYYHNDYGTVQKQELVQNWWYKEDASRWFVESDFPVFK